MLWKLRDNWKSLLTIVLVFSVIYFLPVERQIFTQAVIEALALARWYAREHVVLCLLPAFLIAGGITVFLSKDAVMKYLGASANKFVAYGVAAVSGTILAVCSCTVLPLFAGIHKRGAGLGPAVAFLYSGPAINILAIVLTANVLGIEMGIARAVGAIVFSIVIGLLMALFFPEKENKTDLVLNDNGDGKPLWQHILFFASMVGVLVFANWAKPDTNTGLWYLLFSNKWIITSSFALGLGAYLIFIDGVKWWKITGIAALTALSIFLGSPVLSFAIGIIGLSFVLISSNKENNEWFSESYGFAKQILPLLFFGVLAAGFFLGRPETEGIIPSQWVHSAVGGNSLRANFFASFAGAFMYFATLTEVPILQGLISNGMGKGPALSLLLAGPALSLPNMLVIRSVMGTKRTLVFIGLVIVMATITGMIYGTLF